MEMTATHDQQHEERPRAPLLMSVQTWIMGLIGTLMIGLFGFLWSLNATIATIKEQSLGRDDKMNVLQQSVNEIRLDQKEQKGNVQDIKERTIRLEDAINSNKTNK